MTNETECECKTPFTCHQMGLCRAGKNSPIGGLHAMQKFQFADLPDAKDARIAELEAECWRMKEERDRAIGWRDSDQARAEAAEAKLAKAVACIEETVLGDLWPDIAEDRARATLADLQKPIATRDDPA